MAKSIIKELIIFLLLCLAIILVLGILMYEYTPMSKTIPNPVSYTTSETVKQELAISSEIDEDKIIMTYEIDSTDLNNYKRIQEYVPGKANPFSSYETAESNTTNENSTTGGTASSGNSSSTGTSGNTTSSNSSGGQYFQDKGTK